MSQATATAPDETDFEEFDFSGSTGAQAARDKSKRAAPIDRLPYFSLSDGESEIVRFLTDIHDHPEDRNRVGWITVNQHNMVATKPKPSNVEGNWPKRMTAVCRHDSVFKGKFPDCWICENVIDERTKKLTKPFPRVWALVAIREEVPDEDGNVIDIKTKMREAEDEDGKKIKVPDVRIVNMSYKNFFGILAGSASRTRTVLDRDWEITRQGSGQNDTEYNFASLDPWEVEYEGEAVKLDLRRSDMLESFFPGLPDLRRIVIDKASDEFYSRLFIPGEDDDEEEAGQPRRPRNDRAPEEAEEEDSEAAKRLRNRVANRVRRQYGSADEENAE